MMDMGFMPQINRVLELTPMKKQCLLFSATMSHYVEKLAGDFVEYPVRVEVSPQATTAETIAQTYYKVPNIRTKINLVEHLLRTDFLGDKSIIFTKTKKSADDVYKYLIRKVLDEVGVIHANKSQNTRINTINAFQNNDIQILVATDVSARGIDISDVKLVINFNVPTHYEDYVHRIGRTGRAYKEGKAISLADKSEEIHLLEIEDLIKMTIPESEWPEEVEITQTPFEENQIIEREIDRMKRKKDPTYKGAFHVSQREQRLKDSQKAKKKKKKKR
jgi:ATP-dependent RNA helicase RhlE